jgi:iron complex transport system substrate-binding protein
VKWFEMAEARRVRALVIGGVPLLWLAAALPGAAHAYTVKDMTGREVTVAAPPRRIVSLVPSVTEILFTIGGQDRLAGVTDFCDFPPEARRKPRVGSMLAPSLEAIVALRPDLVVATTAGNRQETFDQLARLGIPVYVVNPSRLAEVLELMTRLAALTGRSEAAEPVVAALRGRIQAVRTRVTPLPRPRVLYVLWPEPLIVPGRGALITELIAAAGGESVTADGGEAYPRYSVEAALARAPEVILLARHGTPSSRISREQWARFRTLPAIRAGRFHDVDGNLLHRYGPRVVDGLERLARLIHPEAFGQAR